MVKPALLTCKYSKNQMMSDISAGFVVGIIAIPLSMALAIAAGATVEMGLYTAIIGGFICAITSGSKYQISGPTGAFAAVIYGIITQFGYSGLFTACFMSGIFLLLAGVFKCGKLLKYIPLPITLAFSTGVATTILTSQVKDFFGLTLADSPSAFILKWVNFIVNFKTINIYSLIIGVVTILIITYFPKLTKKIPAPFVALIVPIPFVIFFSIPTDTIGSVFGAIDTSFPGFALPDFSNARDLLDSAFTLALIGAISTLLSASAADSLTSERHDADMELISQGAGNIVTACFGALPVSGAIARTCSNASIGGKTPISAVFHSIVVLAITIFVIPYAGYIPMAALAGVLFTVCYNMVNWQFIKYMKYMPKSDILIFFSVYFVTILFDLVLAIEIGLVLASLLFLKKMADATKLRKNEDIEIPEELKGKIEIYHIDGPMFFPVIDRLIKETEVHHKLDMLVLDFSYVSMIDLTAMRGLSTIISSCEKDNTTVYLTSLSNESLNTLMDAGYLERFYVTDTIMSAIYDYSNKEDYVTI